MGRLSGILGIVAILLLGYLFSTNRRKIRINTVAWGLGLQFAFALLVLKTPAGQATFRWIGEKITRSRAKARSRTPGFPGCSGGHAGEFSFGLHRRHASVNLRLTIYD